MDLVSLLVLILVLGLIFGLVWMLIDLLPIPQPFNVAAKCVLILIAVLVLLDKTGVLSGAHFGT